MKKNTLYLFGLLFLLFSLSACSSINQKEGSSENKITIENLENRELEISSELIYEESLELQYAERFAVDYYNDGYKVLTLADSSRFLLVPEGGTAPADLPPNITILQSPMQDIYLVATAVMDIFCELEALNTIHFSGTKADGWYIEEARQAMEAGDIVYAGKYSMPDYELIVSKGCNLAIQSTMISHAPEVSEKLQEFGIPVMVDYSSYEDHPLGRVEWIKFYGALLGKEEKADEIFRKQEEILARVTKEEKTDKTVAFFYITTNGTVNVRKSSDYVAQMIELAGGQYIFEKLGSDSDNKSSVNLSMEEFYTAAKDADVLIYNSTTDAVLQTVDELLAKNEILADFKAVKEGNVWCSTGSFYQQSMSIGIMIEDIHNILSGDEESQKENNCIYKLQ